MEDVLEKIVSTAKETVEGLAKNEKVLYAVLGFIAAREIANRTSLKNNKDLLGVLGGLLGYNLSKKEN